MEMIFAPFIAHLTSSLALQVFVVSALVLSCGVAALVWIQAVHLSFIDAIDLKDLEFSHPHLPSLRVIVTTLLCSIALLLVGISTFNGTPPFEAPYEILYLAAFFILGGMAGILSELRWRGSREYPFAVIVGTALAFLLLVVKHTFAQNQLFLGGVLLLLLIACLFLGWKILYESWTNKGKGISVIVFIFWLLLYFGG